MTLIALDGSDFPLLFTTLQRRLLGVEPFNVGEWQSQKIGDNPMQHMRELNNVSFEMPIPSGAEALGELTGARLPWAEDHFLERTGGEPLNPSPSEAWWPFRKKSADGDTNKDHKSEGKAFSHTYPERMWPKHAGKLLDLEPMEGIRFKYGDLEDVVNQLARSRNTRQAFLPIWFPEDTGAVHGKRVPCTIGYHFLIRDNQLQVTYYMRSCDLIRHFQDDVYMAGRLGQWLVNELNTRVFPDEYDIMSHPTSTRVGNLIMHIVNLHVFEGDVPMMKYRDGKDLAWNIA